MNNPAVTLMKTCSSCGQQKPLSAFLQLTGPEGATYGNICASCRKTQLENPAEKITEEGTKSSSGVKLDAKAKVYGDTTKEETRQQVDENYKEGREKNATQEVALDKKKAQIKAGERSHRESFLSSHSFTTADKKEASRVVAEQQAIERTAKEETTKGEFEKTGIESGGTGGAIGGPSGQDFYFGLKLKHGGIGARTFLSALGSNSPFSKGFKNLAESAKESSAITSEEQPLTKFVDKEWTPPSSPSSKRGGGR